MTNKNTEYELLVARIHQGLLDYDGFDNVKVEHNIKLQGKSGASHQIDVYWSFELAGNTYQTCIECKNYSSPVKKSHVAAFAAVLDDIGNTNGVIATTSSFQKGAKLLANHNNIRLVCVNHLLRTIHLRVQPCVTNYDSIDIEFNQDSVKEALQRHELNAYKSSISLEDGTALLNKNGQHKCTLRELLTTQHLIEGNNTIETTELFIDLENIGLVMIERLHVKVSRLHLPSWDNVIEAPHDMSAVIEDILGDDIHYLSDNGSVVPATNNTEDN